MRNFVKCHKRDIKTKYWETLDKRLVNWLRTAWKAFIGDFTLSWVLNDEEEFASRRREGPSLTSPSQLPYSRPVLRYFKTIIFLTLLLSFSIGSIFSVNLH